MATAGFTVSVDERTRFARTRLGQVVLGKWRLERLIGIGGMAAVFEAAHRNGNRVAIKVLHPDLATSDDTRERFLAEGYAANRVSHPGVVTVRDEGTTEDGAVFLVMDLLRGQTVAERLDAGQRPFSVGEVLEVADQLLDVLVHAHDRGIVHRDIKPENVFLTQDRRVRLLDFGIARVEASTRTHATRAGTALGTPAFMSPEQAHGRWEDLDGRTDLWSLGATMYLLLAGVPVREQGSVTELLLSALTRPAPSLGEVAALPRSVVAVVDRALSFDRADRFPDARSMQLAVRAAQSELRAPDSRATLPPPSIEPMAMSLRTPRPDGRYQRPSVSTVRPVAANTTPRPSATEKPGLGALPLYISLGFAVGMGIVIAARYTVQPPAHATFPVQAEQVAAAPQAVELANSPASASASALARPAPPPSSLHSASDHRRPHGQRRGSAPQTPAKSALEPLR
jgi:serine/threonine protein kinase